jgi:ribose/xylose/arabinose/galactoside ABC-type transport system permease subunit
MMATEKKSSVSKRNHFQKILTNPLSGIILAFLLLCFTIGAVEALLKSEPVFFHSANLMNIFLQTSINTIIAVGVTFVILTGGIDLSVGSIVALCNILFGMSMLAIGMEHTTLQLVAGLAIALTAGLCAGLTNGSIAVHWRIPPFIVTLGMLGIGRGLALWVSHSQTRNLIGQTPAAFLFIGNGHIAGVPVPAILALLVVGIGHFLLKYTLFGRYVLAIGGNEEAARLSGVRVGYFKIIAYGLCGLLVGLAAVVQTSRLGSANPTIGTGYELYAIAAVIIGGTSLMGGKGTILGTLIGALIIGVLNNGLTLMNIPDEIKQIIIGSVIILAVMVDRKRL